MSADHSSQNLQQQNAPTPSIPKWRKALYSTFVVIFLFALPELGLRIAGLPSEPSKPQLGSREFADWLTTLSLNDFRSGILYQEDRELLWRLQADNTVNTINLHRGPDGENQPVRITINKAGHRGHPCDSSENDASLNILCMGDSEFFGYPLDDSEVMPVVLERELSKAQGDHGVQVINGGCQGYSSAQGWKWYQQQFANYNYDWLLLCYLNNDAWRNPVSDQVMLEQASAPSAWLGQMARHSNLLQWASSLSKIPEEDYVRRVSLDEYKANYGKFIAAARRRSARVLLIDYCFPEVFPGYEPYSNALREIATEHEVAYFHVRQSLQPVFEDENGLDPYLPLLSKVARRWGSATLAEAPHLCFYAEIDEPIHLNEVGNTWLVEQLLDYFLSQETSTTPN